jgi:two-component system chemotaxis sensor kinase CheA
MADNSDFQSQLLETFKAEAEEHLKSITEGLLVLEKSPAKDGQKEILETIFREAHSLKGGARAVNHSAVQQICQSLESVLSDLHKGKLQFSKELCNTLFATVDLISQSLFSEEQASEEMIENLHKAVSQLEQIHQGTPFVPEEPMKAADVSSKVSSKDKTIRISQTKLDKLVYALEELLDCKLAVGDRASQLKELLNDFESWETQWKQKKNTILQQNMNQATKDFIITHYEQMKALGGLLSYLEKNASQDHRYFGSMIDNVLEDTKKLLMHPFGSILESFPRMVRDLAQQLGKQVELEIAGEEIEVDKRILEEMKDPLIHIVRNSIDHGIELPEERIAAKKHAAGSIKILASQISGNSVEIIIEDDGKGLDLEKIKQSVKKTGRFGDQELAEMSDAEAQKLIFLSGISTSKMITEISGRGLGMGIVAEKVEKTGGRITVSSIPGKGTLFKIILPLTLATFRGVLIKIDEQGFFIPVSHVQKVLRVRPEEIHSVEGRSVITQEGRPLAFVPLQTLLNMPLKHSHAKAKPALILKSGETYCAIGIEEIMTEQEIFIKSLGYPLEKVKNMASATILEGGKVVPVLDPVDLVKSVARLGGSFVESSESKETVKEKKSILIAEDSATARMLLKNILTSAEFATKTAVDGVEAWGILQTEHFDLVLTDIEMPRMNGLELTKRIRNTEKLQQIPVIICTSLGSQEDRERGMEVGASAYIEKNNFTQGSLLSIIQRLIG